MTHCSKRAENCLLVGYFKYAASQLDIGPDLEEEGILGVEAVS